MAEIILPTLAGIQTAARDLAHHLEPTPLIRSEILSRELEADVWLKLECISPIASFKLRGALNAILIAQADSENKISRAVTFSTGNHGQGVAYAARIAGLPADIFLPTPANQVKKAMIEAFGGRVHETGNDIEETKARALAFCEEEGGIFIDDGESLAVMEGAATMGLEIAQFLPEIDWVIVPMGIGNAVAGTAAALKSLQPDVRAASVQSDSAPAMTESFHARRALERPSTTLADGLAVSTPATLTLAALLEFLDEAWLVSDEAMLAAVHTLAECAHLLVEPSGAAALAGGWENREKLREKRVVMILTGANMSAQLLGQALATPPFFKLD